MATSVGSLVVSLEANIAKFSTDMKSAAETTQKTMKGMTDAVSGVKSELLSLAASFVSVAAVVQSVKSAISLGDELKQMSDATGIAISKLDQLSIVAKLNGASLETIATSTKFLTKSMVEAQDSTSKTGKLFTELGISVRDASGNLRATDEVMGDVAKALNGIENETTRAAVGTAILGKGYLAMAATLRNYEEDQRKANEVLEKFGGVSEQAASLADDLGDKFTLLGEGSKRALLNGLVPGMAAVAQAVQELIDQGGAFQTGFGEVISTVASFVSQSLISLMGTFKVVGTTIAAVMASIATASLQPLKDLPGEIAKIEAQVIGAQARIRTAAQFKGLDDSDQISRAAGAQDRLNKTKADAVRLNSILSDSNKKASKDVIDYANEITKLNNEMAKLSGSDGGMTHLTAALEQIEKDLRAGKIVTNEQIDAYINMARRADELALRVKALAYEQAQFVKGLQDADSQTKKLLDADEAYIDSLNDQNKAMKEQHATLGMTANAYQQMITAEKLDMATKAGDIALTEALTERLKQLQQQARDQAFVQSVQAWGQALESVSASVADFFVDLVENGSSAFKRLWDSFKRWALAALAEIAAKQIVVSIVGAIGLGGAAGAQASGGLLASGTTGLLGALGGGSGGAGGGLLNLLGLGTGPGFMQGLGNLSFGISDFTQLVGQGVGITQAASTAFAGLGSSVSAVLGPLGLFVAGVSLLSGFLKSKGGGPMTREFGTSGADISAFGDFSAAHKLVGTDAASSAAYMQAAATANGTYEGVVKALGGTSGAAAFAFYTSQDPKGTAPNQLDVRAMVGGRNVYTANIEDQLGRDPAVLQARLALEAQRALLAALQATEFPKYLSDIFKSVDAAGATEEQIGRLLATATAIKAVVDAIPLLGEAFTKLDPASINAVIEAVGGIEQFTASMGFLAANFMTAADQAAEAQRTLEEGFAGLGIAIPETHAAFLELLNSFDLTTESGRALYAAVLALSGIFIQVKGTAEQAAQSVTEAGEAIADAGEAVADAGEAIISAFTVDTSKYGTAASHGVAGYLEHEAAVREKMATAGTTLGGQRADFFGSLAGQGVGDFGQKLALQLQYIASEIAKVQSDPKFGVSPKLQSEVKALQGIGVSLAQTLAFFGDLKTRYGPAAAEQLVKLSQTYKDQVAQLQGNAVALDLLNTSFEEQWNAIINGTANGVDGTMDELKRLQQGILDYVDSLKISELSPLTPTQKLAEARAQYESDLAKASTGDTKALGDVTGSADAFLKLARDFFASSSSYTDIFNMVTGQLTTLGTADLAAIVPPMNAADQALLDVLPTGSKLMSAADLEAVAGLFLGLGDQGAAGAILPSSIPIDVADKPKGWSTFWQHRGKDGSASTTEDLSIHDTMAGVAASNSRDADRLADKIGDKIERSQHAIVEALTVGKK